MERRMGLRPGAVQFEHDPTRWSHFDGGKSAFRADAGKSAMPVHLARAATNPGSRLAPPQAGFFCALALLRFLAAVPSPSSAPGLRSSDSH